MGMKETKTMYLVTLLQWRRE